MERYRISVAGEGLVFSAAHFLVFDGGGSESLHGHDYRVRVELAGAPDTDGLVHDFVDLRERVRRLVARLDHRVLLPSRCPGLDVSRRDGEVHAIHPERSYRFPADDVAVLPVANTSTELLAGHLADELASELAPLAPGLDEISVEIEEAPGCAASAARPVAAPEEDGRP